MSKSQQNSKSKDFMNDRESFYKELKLFHESRGTQLRTPVVSGTEIDLYLFYSLVLQRGGYYKVTQHDLWDSFMRPLRLPHPCVNGSALMKKLYSIHLEKFEKAKGPPNRDDDNDMDDDFRSRNRGGSSRQSHGGAYISASGETLRTGAKPIAGPSERLALSLLSPFPNEQDFAVNVCTVLAADFSNRLPLSTTPHILDFLLAHAGVYNHFSLRDTIGRSYFDTRGRYPDDFWRLSAGGGGARELADETKFMTPGLEEPELIVQAMAAHNTLTDALAYGHKEVIERILDEDFVEDWVSEPSEEDSFFAPTLPGGARCVYTQRVIQIASIVRSLSFHEENLPYLARNNTLIRFLLLCANCWVGTLRQSGLDTLGNVCAELVVKDPATCLISRHVLSTIHACLMSTDRSRILAALEMLNKLSQNEANEEVLLKHIEPKVYIEVCAQVRARDIMIVVCALECACALSELGSRAADLLLRAPRILRTLLGLCTVEAQSYGPKACILMRVVETVSGTAPQESSDKQPQTQPPLSQISTQAQQTPTKTPQDGGASGGSGGGGGGVGMPPPTTLPTPSPAPSPAPAPSPSASPFANLQLQHNQQKTIQENEQFACAWLRATCCLLPRPGPAAGSAAGNAGLSAGDLYRQYAAACSKLQRRGLIAPAHFPRLVRSVFGGSVGPNTVTVSTGETQSVYIGITTKKTGQPQGPASPILKAQLTTKPEVKPVTAPQTPVQQTTSHPHLSQALDTPTNSTLIKHLLANKVSLPTPPPVQVAQRQQNLQKMVAATPSNATTVQNNTVDQDPEALIKCTTILPGGVANTTPGLSNERVIVMPLEENISTNKEEPVQIQIDEQQQMTIKSSQNKMLADLLEKKSNPPVQVVTMAPQTINHPTIQITETGQIVQVKQDSNTVLQMNSEPQVLSQSGAFYQIKNEQGQVIQLKNEQGQIIHLKGEQQVGHIVHGLVKTEDPKAASTNHISSEPPTKRVKVEEKKEATRESVSKTAANLYAALAASALEDEDDLMLPKTEAAESVPQSVIVTTSSDNTPVMIQEPIMQVQQQSMQLQPQTVQVPQPMIHMQPMDMGNMMVSQPGQIIIQEKPVSTQPTQFVQQPMQIIATPSSQGGISYLAPNNMMQKTIIIVQGATGGGPITLTVNNPGGLDEATLNSVIAQATEAITQQQIMQNSGVIQSTQRVIVSQPALVSTSQLTMVKAAIAQSTPQLTASQQPIITTQPQPHKAQIINQPQIVMTQKPGSTIVNGNQIVQQNQIMGNQQIITGNPQLITGNSQIITGNSQIITGNSQILTGNSQIITGNPQIITGNPQIITSNPQIITSNPQIITGNSQMHTSNQQLINQTVNQKICGNPPIITGSPQIVTGSPQIISGNPQIITANQQIISGSPQIISGNQQIVTGNQQIVTGNPQIISGNQQIVTGNQQIIAVSNNQQIIVNTPVKAGVHRMVQQGTKTVIQNTSNVQTNQQKSTQQVVRQVIGRQPVMVGGNVIGEKEVLINQVVEPAPASTPPPPALVPSTPSPAANADVPWICHWKGCGKTFTSSQSVFGHVAGVHCPRAAGGEAACQWLDCDRLPRKTSTFTSSQSVFGHVAGVHCPRAAGGEAACQWLDCDRLPRKTSTFTSSQSVFGHVAGVHCPRAAGGEAACQWLDCDRLPRKTFALLNHIADTHCTQEALKAVFTSKRHLAVENDSNKPSTVTYPPNAAMAALNKHTQDYLNPRELMKDENEGPVTKSIRLTAALILRNIVIYSNAGRRYLKSYESHLATIAMSNVEASRTIAQILYDINNI